MTCLTGLPYTNCLFLLSKDLFVCIPYLIIVFAFLIMPLFSFSQLRQVQENEKFNLLYQNVLLRYTREQDVQEKRRLLSSLGATTDPLLIQRSLELSLSDIVRSQVSCLAKT